MRNAYLVFHLSFTSLSETLASQQAADTHKPDRFNMRKNSDKHPKHARKLIARGIEPLESRIAPATLVSYNAGTHVLSIDMNAAGDQANIHLNPAKTAVIVSSNTGPDQTFLIGTMPISSYAVQNEGTADRLTVDFLNGDPINGDAFQWVGGNHGGEHLAFTGSGSAGENVSWLPDAAASGKGALTIAGGLVTPINGTDTLSYNNFGMEATHRLHLQNR